MSGSEVLELPVVSMPPLFKRSFNMTIDNTDMIESDRFSKEQKIYPLTGEMIIEGERRMNERLRELLSMKQENDYENK